MCTHFTVFMGVMPLTKISCMFYTGHVIEADNIEKSRGLHTGSPVSVFISAPHVLHGLEE